MNRNVLSARGRAILVFLSFFCLFGDVSAESLTLAPENRPEWLRREGIIMAGSWEPLPFRVVRDSNGEITVPTEAQIKDYQYEHSRQMLDKLKALGVNFIRSHCYKGMGLKAEAASMAEAAEFARLCHENGFHVGVYNDSGTFFWEPFFKELPQAKDWALQKEDGSYMDYFTAKYRYFRNRNHPNCQAFYEPIIKFAVEEVQADLLHFDNYIYGPGFDDNSVERFRGYLRDNFSSAQLAGMNIDDIGKVLPPGDKAQGTLLHRVWLRFITDSMTESYCQINRYARSLRKDILIENNPQGIENKIRAPIEHGGMLQGGEAFWHEGSGIGYDKSKKQLRCNIPTYKVARKMNNMAFLYTTNPLEMAESMAFNLDCLGCICWFEYGKIVAMPGSAEPVSSTLVPFVRFFKDRSDILRLTEVIADVAILRNFSSQVFADSKYAQACYGAEQCLIDNRVPFQIVYDSHLENLRGYKTLILAGCVALSDAQISYIENFVKSGGRLCIIGPVALYDNWLLDRKQPVFDNLPQNSVVRIKPDGDYLKAIELCNGRDFSLKIDAPAGIAAELTAKGDTRFVHLVNYRDDGPVKKIRVRLSIPEAGKIRSVCVAAPNTQKDITLEFSVSNNFVEFEVPEIDVYAVAIVKMGKNI